MVTFDPVSHLYDLLPIPNHPAAFREHLRHVPAPRLDLGGGTGKTTVQLHGSDGSAVVVDLSRPMLRRGLWAGRAFHPVQGAAQALPLASDTFHAVTVTEAFHHFAPHQGAVLAEAARVLTEDGILLMEEIDPSRFLGRTIALGERVLRFGSRFHEPDALERLVAQRFDEVSWERTGSFTYLVVATDPRRP